MRYVLYDIIQNHLLLCILVVYPNSTIQQSNSKFNSTIQTINSKFNNLCLAQPLRTLLQTVSCHLKAYLSGGHVAYL